MSFERYRDQNGDLSLKYGNILMRTFRVCLCALAETRLALKMSGTRKRKIQTAPRVFHARICDAHRRMVG
jgi:hypothetical protein